ncbi:MAG: hypothetical protein DIU78_008215 [Pseudomonadota bacterium]|nr:MAG: hypothetical protein DIU78_12465 [Pseudomonadota bacterium]
MSFAKRVRQTHRWLSLAFTLAVIANIAAMFVAPSAVWVGFLALVPLVPLLITGLYLFVLPYTAKGRAAASVAHDASSVPLVRSSE